RRVWTIEEANALVPKLTELVREQLERAADIERRWNELQTAMAANRGRDRGADAPIASESATPRVRDELGSMEYDLQSRVRAYEAGWRAVEALGAVIKDPRIGLCDFYGQVDGRYVWLCWRFGETSIGYYHDLDAGFAGRKPLTAATRQRLLN